LAANYGGLIVLQLTIKERNKKMWFKQLQIFQLTTAMSYAPEKLAQQLEALAFTSCLPSMPNSIGWTAPLELDDAPLVQAMNGYMMICMQSEDKILPAAVVSQALNDKIKQIQVADGRRVRSKEKLAMKDEIIMTLLPRAFTKISRLYAYIDTKNNQLILSTTNAKKIEQFMSLFKKSVTEDVKAFDIHKVSPVMTNWVKSQKYPQEFSVEKACLLQDPNQQNRTIRCQQQDLFAPSIQSIIKDGCEVKQLALSWQDRVNFVIEENLLLRGIQYQEEILTAVKEIECETEQQQFDADFFIMSQTLTALLQDLLKIFSKSDVEKEVRVGKEVKVEKEMKVDKEMKVENEIKVENEMKVEKESITEKEAVVA
jgi:recombination associated protein RdgC